MAAAVVRFTAEMRSSGRRRKETWVILRAKAPLRISFGGGGSDVSPYCDERGGAVLSATVNRFAYAGLRPGGNRFHVRSLDYDVSVSYSLDEPFVFDGQLDLAKAVIDWFRRERGISEGAEIFLQNDAPPERWAAS